jgi:hypothetical protein
MAEEFVSPPLTTLQPGNIPSFLQNIDLVSKEESLTWKQRFRWCADTAPARFGTCQGFS